MHHNQNKTGEYSRRILLAVAGTTPQILTETLYALSQSPAPFIPTEVNVITTSEGAHRIRLQLLDEKNGQFHAFCRDYGLTGKIKFEAANVKVITGANGIPLQDIISPQDNEQAADQIVAWLRAFTHDPDCAIHACLAGGRKTMGFYLGYGLSLYGREQDKLSHVLVSPEFEAHREFFYKPPVPQTLFASSLVGSRVDERPVSTADAQIWLAEIPFVRLRNGLPAPLLAGKGSYTDAVQAVQESLPDSLLILDVAQHRAICGGIAVKMTPRDFAFYLWHARRSLCMGERAAISWKETEPAVMDEYFATYLEVLRGDTLHPDLENARRAFAHGFDKDAWAGNVYHVNHSIRAVLGAHRGKPFELASRRIAGKGRLTEYWLDYAAERISFAGIQQGAS